MHKTIRMFAWVLILALAATPALAGPGNANFFIGQRWIDSGEDELEDVEDQPAFGVSVDFQTGDLPFSWFAGLYASAKEEDVASNVTLTAGVAELSFGLGKVWNSSNTRPFVHGGVTYTSLEIELDTPGGDFDEDDQSPAIYGEGGVYWRIGEAFNIGLGGRFIVGTDYEIDGVSLEADYLQAGLILGWGWGD